jgi:hypothetical protein
VLPNMVSDEFQPGPKPKALIERYGLAGKKILLTISRISTSDRNKGHDRVIEALPAILKLHPGAVYAIVIALLFLLAVYALAALYQDNEIIVAVNQIGSCVLILIMMYGCWHNLRQSPFAIWSPLVWFRVATAAYFGFGQLVPYIANDVSMAYLRYSYNFSDAEILKLNVISNLGVICILAGAAFVRMWISPPSLCLFATGATQAIP